MPHCTRGEVKGAAAGDGEKVRGPINIIIAMVQQKYSRPMRGWIEFPTVIPGANGVANMRNTNIPHVNWLSTPGNQ